MSGFTCAHITEQWYVDITQPKRELYTMQTNTIQSMNAVINMIIVLSNLEQTREELARSLNPYLYQVYQDKNDDRQTINTVMQKFYWTLSEISGDLLTEPLRKEQHQELLQKLMQFFCNATFPNAPQFIPNLSAISMEVDFLPQIANDLFRCIQQCRANDLNDEFYTTERAFFGYQSWSTNWTLTEYQLRSYDTALWMFNNKEFLPNHEQVVEDPDLYLSETDSNNESISSDSEMESGYHTN